MMRIDFIDYYMLLESSLLNIFHFVLNLNIEFMTYSVRN